MGVPVLKTTGTFFLFGAGETFFGVAPLHHFGRRIASQGLPSLHAVGVSGRGSGQAEAPAWPSGMPAAPKFGTPRVPPPGQPFQVGIGNRV